MFERIIFNFPTNLGDTILSLPVLDKLKASYPQAKITAIVSPKTKEFLLRNNFIDDVVVFDKRWRIREKMRFCWDLKGKYDLIIDLKNSLLPFLLGIRRRTPFWRRSCKDVHIKDEYLSLVKKIVSQEPVIKRSSFLLTPEEEKKWYQENIPPSIFVGCSSRSAVKRYPYLKEVVFSLAEDYPLVIVGGNEDREFYKDILKIEGVIDLVGKTTMSEVFFLLENYAVLFLGVDSALLHLASYIDLPIVAIFGPTSFLRYGPWSTKSIVLRKEDLSCSPCGKSICPYNSDCMKIPPHQVVEAVRKLVSYEKS
ncbi:MAG TPA: glycosyltransferase family 9 protein [Candidatus Omnitrophica bacterium]|nr:glycosyltransferase family 9 protein [Candidatus Omnitrophota bacterium]